MAIVFGLEILHLLTQKESARVAARRDSLAGYDKLPRAKLGAYRANEQVRRLI
jgi:hypothetical protein